MKLVSYAKNMPKAGEMFGSNRLPQPLEEYNTVPVDTVKHFEEAIQNSETLEDLQGVLVEMSDKYLAIVGSRDYAYRCDAMNNMIPIVKANPYQINLITRSFGLRQKVSELI